MICRAFAALSICLKALAATRHMLYKYNCFASCRSHGSQRLPADLASRIAALRPKWEAGWQMQDILEGGRLHFLLLPDKREDHKQNSTASSTAT